jgi:hypothetical protein
MKLNIKHLSLGSLLATLLCATVPVVHADQWTAPTPEELSMTSQPGAPGAPAVYLFREDITDDHLHDENIYVRLKVLTEEGKKYANVELNSVSVSMGGGFTVGDISGRTIHPDGTVIPFTGKPYEKVIEKTQDYKYKAKVFTLPDVEVGSIIEYRYSLRTDDHYFRSPDWYIQTELYTRKAHYLWRPTSQTLVSNDDRGQLTSSIAWFKSLPPGVDVSQTRTPGGGPNGGDQITLELQIHDVPPTPREEYMPPISNFSSRVLFYYSPYRTLDEFWKNEGKYWSKRMDKFIGPGPKVVAAVHDLTLPGDTDDQKLHKIYAAIMKFENTSYTRERSTSEEKSEGLGAIHTTDDILERKRGNDDQLTELFVAMARAAGMKAYLMWVTDRKERLFTPGYLNLRQLDDYIAVVTVGGKEQFFDPGSRYCPYGHIAWEHSYASGMRQIEGGTTITQNSPGDSYADSRELRVANLSLDHDGAVNGTIKLNFTGQPALAWRQSALTGDRESVERELRTHLERMLPGGMEVKVADIEKLEDYEEPLVVNYNVKGPIGSSAGKRLLITGDLFETNTKPAFPHEKRDLPVYFHYMLYTQDAIRINLPEGIQAESVPTGGAYTFQKLAAYKIAFESTPKYVTIRREYARGDFLFMPKDYAELRTFYNQFETKDQESIVLTASPIAAAKTPTGN